MQANKKTRYAGDTRYSKLNGFILRLFFNWKKSLKKKHLFWDSTLKKLPWFTHIKTFFLKIKITFFLCAHRKEKLFFQPIVLLRNGKTLNYNSKRNQLSYANYSRKYKCLTFTGMQIRHSKRSANAKLAKNTFVGLFIFLYPRMATRISRLPIIPKRRVRLKWKKYICIYKLNSTLFYKEYL